MRQQRHPHGEWLNRVARVFRNITTERVRRGAFTSVPEWVAAIDESIAHRMPRRARELWR